MSFDIQLKSGRHVHLARILQYKTYGGLLEGYPTRRLIDRAIASATKCASSIPFGFGKPHLIRPVETDLEIPKDLWFRNDEEWRPIQIPPIACISKFESTSPSRDSDKMCSVLVVVWFQEEFALPIDPDVLDRIQRLDWGLLAFDADY